LYGWGFLIRGHVGDSFVQRARNLLIGMFLETDCTDLFFIDDDIGWPPGALARMLRHPVDIVGATYRVKTDDNVRYPMRELDYKNPHRKRMELNPENNLIEVDAVPGGFLRMSRAAVERLVESRKDTWFRDNGIVAYNLCDVILLPERTGYEGEDYTFCKNIRAAGMQVWLDPHLRMSHVGEQVFEGCLWDDLQSTRPQNTAQRIKEALRREDGGLPPYLPAKAQQSAIELKWLTSKMAGAEKILEVGSCIGESLKVFAKHAIKGAKLRSIDLGVVGLNGDFETAGLLRKAIEDLKKQGFDADVMIANSRSPEAVKWAEENGPYDFVYIDGDHSYEGVKADFKNYGPLGDLVGFHDIGHAAHDVNRFWQELKAKDYQTEEMIASDQGTGLVYFPRLEPKAAHALVTGAFV
jgi:predicted O-methyltransferase YrrM